jgi:hypothetical protein
MNLKAWYLGLSPKTQQLLYEIDKWVGSKIWKDPRPVSKTISEHLAEDAKQGKLLGTMGCSVLNAIDPGHCERADSPDR